MYGGLKGQGGSRVGPGWVRDGQLDNGEIVLQPFTKERLGGQF